MADANEEIVGAIGVSVTGDYSSLAASYSSAQDQAATAGEAIADAFNSGVAGVSDAADVVTEALGGIGPAGDDAAGGLNDFAESAGAAGEAAGEAESKLADMAEQLTAVGEALVITEGLTELGTEALKAADSIAVANSALAGITGSAETAHETIEGLEQLGMTDGLAMPSLLTAATRMQQLLGPTTDVTAQLGMVADGAARMGTDIDTAAQKFDLMATSGTASGRTLTALGLSLQSLTTAFNQVIPGADATASSVATMFKALDQTDRITVLDAALQQLAGTAQVVAGETFGGQWQQLANAWEGVMVQVGQAILPVVSDLIDLTKTDIVPFIQDAVSAFNSLSEPMKDTVVGLGLAAAAIIPLTGGLAALGLAFSGLEGLLPAVTGLLEAFGIGAETVAAEETTAAAATEGLGTAAVAAEAGVAGLAGVVTGVLAAAITGGAALWVDYQTRLDAARSSLQGITDVDLKSFLAGIATVAQGTGNASTATEQWEAKLGTLKEALDIGAISAAQYAAAVKLIEAAQDALAKQNLADSITSLTSGLTILTGDTQKATDQQTLLNQVLQDAQTKFAQVAAQYQANNASAQQYISAQAAVTTATEAVTTAQGKAANAIMDTAIEQAKTDQENQVAVAGMQDWLTTSEAIVPVQKAQLAALQDLDAALPPLVSQFAGLDGQITALQSAMPGFGVIVTSLSSGPLVGLQSALNEANDKVAALAAQMAAGENVGQQYEKALTAQLKDLIALNEANAEQATGLQGSTDAYSLATIAVAAAQAKLDTLNLAVQTNITLSPQVTAAQNALATALKNQAAAAQQSTTDIYADVDAQVKLYGAMGNIATAAPAAASGIASIGTAAAGAVGQLNDVAAAINGIAADMQKAFGSGAANVTGAGGAGTTVSRTGLGGFGQGVFSVTETPNVTQKQLQEQVTGGSSPADIAGVEAGMNALGYDDDYSFDWPSGFSGTAEAAMAAQKAGTFNAGSTSASSSSGTSSTPTTSQPLNSTYSGSGSTTSSTPTSSVITGDPAAQAQAVVNALNALSGGGATSALAQQIDKLEDIVLNGGGFTTSQASQLATLLNQAGLNANGTWTSGGGTTSTGATSTSASTPISTASGGSGTSAIDGGSYPAVTAHQAAGEIWAVDTSGVGGTLGAGTVASSITEQIATTVNQSGDSGGGVTAAVSAIGGVAQAIATNSSVLGPISTSLIATTAATQQIAEAIGGLVTKLTSGSIISSGLPTQTGGSGTVYQSALPTNPDGTPLGYVPTGNPQGAYVPPAASTPIANVPGYNPFGPTSTGGAGNTTVTVSIDARGSMGVSAQQMSAAIVSQVTQQLFTNGARITR